LNPVSKPHAWQRMAAAAFLAVLFFVPAVGSAASAAKKTVYLTFDADMTPGMLARLKNGEVAGWYDQGLVDYLLQNKIPATIFVTGLFVKAYPDLVKSLAASGNITIGNHTYDHDAFTDKCYGLRQVGTDARKRWEMLTTQLIIEKTAGVKPTLFRYPGLCSSSLDDVIVRAAGLTPVGANVVSGDAFNSDVSAIEREVLFRVKNGSVVLMHLGGPNAPASAAVLEKIKPELEKRGFVFAKL